MAKYESYSAKRNIPSGTTVWAYAFEETSKKNGMSLKQAPIKGTIFGNSGYDRMFIPFRKNLETEYARSKKIAIDSRNYADTEAEAIEGYNDLIEKQIKWYRKKIGELENELI